MHHLAPPMVFKGTYLHSMYMYEHYGETKSIVRLFFSLAWKSFSINECRKSMVTQTRILTSHSIISHDEDKIFHLFLSSSVMSICKYSLFCITIDEIRIKEESCFVQILKSSTRNHNKTLYKIGIFFSFKLPTLLWE